MARRRIASLAGCPMAAAAVTVSSASTRMRGLGAAGIRSSLGQDVTNRAFQVLWVEVQFAETAVERHAASAIDQVKAAGPGRISLLRRRIHAVDDHGKGQAQLAHAE